MGRSISDTMPERRDGIVQGNVRGREYVGYDSSINIKFLSGVGFTRCETGFEARKRRQTWNHDQLAKRTARPGKLHIWPQLGRTPQGTLHHVLRRWDSERVLMGLILDKNQQQRDLANLVKPLQSIRFRLPTFYQLTSSLWQTSNRSFLLLSSPPRLSTSELNTLPPFSYA